MNNSEEEKKKKARVTAAIKKVLTDRPSLEADQNDEISYQLDHVEADGYGFANVDIEELYYPPHIIDSIQKRQKNP
ncbi:Oidioi.mRNA.OKI2018_I69.PAR.g9961.t1.cds [Oikopleura dioica]|uniref:Oidioi.mRNA.OKI2018_I69.PAR.g9961.t1.cds n=1 Tax=Oikopleura dioica TaxID=34765 RepID=A0ABN7RN77_OIKDI|nr:Oidioi.mRNA.OKI2018_I69.PAR.g9961.t1.cds [Oikopleura dioica]